MYLIGGGVITSEKVKVDGSVEGSFDVKYDQRYTLHFIVNSAIYLYRWACAIPDEDNEELIITGGSGPVRSVRSDTAAVYSEAGWQRDLAPLNQGRRFHACGSYVNGGKMVNHIICMFKSYIQLPVSHGNWGTYWIRLS